MADATETRQKVAHWIEEGQFLVPGLLDQHERLCARAEAAEQECEKLRQQLGDLRSEKERLEAERSELAEVLRPMTEVAQKLRMVPKDSLLTTRRD